MSSRVYDSDRRTGRFPDVGAAFHLGSETAPEPLTPPPPPHPSTSAWAKEKREGVGRKAEVSAGEFLLTQTLARSEPEPAINLPASCREAAGRRSSDRESSSRVCAKILGSVLRNQPRPWFWFRASRS